MFNETKHNILWDVSLSAEWKYLHFYIPDNLVVHTHFSIEQLFIFEVALASIANYILWGY